MSWALSPSSALAVAVVGRLPPEAEAAVAATGARVSDVLAWDALDALPTGSADRPLVAAVVSPVTGHGPLERLADVVEEAGLEAVVAFPADALDAVAAVLMVPGITLLCEPRAGDWATALMLAAVRAEAMPAGVREGDDRERLQRLNAEVARIAALLAGLVEVPSGEVVGDRPRGYGGPPAEIAVDPAEVRRVIRARQLRGQFFDPRLLEDPGWDMLLDLFAAELEDARVSVSSLCIASGVAPTTALRWISRMVDAGLLVRVADPGDRRRAFLALSPAASDGMRRYVAAVKGAGLPLA